MGNLRKPYFWGYLLIQIYFIIFLIAGIITMPSIWIKIICSIGSALICYAVVVSFQRPVSNKWFVGLTVLFVGLVFMIGGWGLLKELLNLPNSVNHYEYTQWYEVLPALTIIQILCGGLAILSSIIGLTSSRKSEI
jgi:hypothetical protein